MAKATTATKTATKKNKRNGDQPTGEIGAPQGAMQDLVGLSREQIFHVFCLFQSFKYRDSMFLMYGINRLEMETLLSLSGYLSIHNRNIVSQMVFIKFCTSSWKRQTKMKGYMAGLKRLDAIGHFEYIRKPGSLCVGITDYGFVLIEAYFKQVFEYFKSQGLRFADTKEQRMKLSFYTQYAIAA